MIITMKLSRGYVLKVYILLGTVEKSILNSTVEFLAH